MSRLSRADVFTYITVLGVVILIGALSADLDGAIETARIGFVLGGAMVVFSEWGRWRTSRR